MDRESRAGIDQEQRLAWSAREFAKLAGFGKTKLYEEAALGRIEIRKIGSKPVVLRPEGERYLNSLPVAKLKQTA